MCSNLVVQILQWFSVCNGYFRTGAGDKNFRCLRMETEPESEILVPAQQPWLEHAVQPFASTVSVTALSSI